VRDQGSIQELAELLSAYGVHLGEDPSQIHGLGFPVVVEDSLGQTLSIVLPEPALAPVLATDRVGLVVADASGFIRVSWGIARYRNYLLVGENLLDTELALLVESGFRGNSGSVLFDRIRFYIGEFCERTQTLAILVVEAENESRALAEAEKVGRSAELMRKLGAALTMHQNLHPLALAAVHELSSVCELAACLLWVTEPGSNRMSLVGSVGASRQGTSAVTQLDPESEITCMAELVAMSRREYVAKGLHENVMTSQLEARFCYLTPGAIGVFPMIVGEKVVGVLEVIAREGDASFIEQLDLFRTASEHLALAVNSSMLFENFERLATNDPLTGIANHRAMQEFLQRRVFESLRNNTMMGVMMIDIDHFRSFNEEEGHDVGDQCLKKVVEAIQACIRPYDLAARYGGEEFTVILPGTNPAACEHVAERIREKIEQISIVGSTGNIRQVTGSIGCAFFPNTSRDPHGLLKAADKALYEAKKAGRNRVASFHGEFQLEHVPVTYDLTTLEILLTEEEKQEGRRLRQLAEPLMRQLAEQLCLSKNQELMVLGLLKVAPKYRRVRDEDLVAFQKLEKSPELRVLLPALHALDERYDGTGPKGLVANKIPLLARVYDVVQDIILNNGADLAHDHGRYDPHIVDLAAGFEEAA